MTQRGAAACGQPYMRTGMCGQPDNRKAGNEKKQCKKYKN